MRYDALRKWDDISRKEKVYKGGDTYVVLIEEQVDDKQRGINDYVESSEGEHIGDLAPKSPRKALERVDAESWTLEESYGERAQKYTCDGHYESRYKVIGLSDLRHIVLLSSDQPR